MTLATVSSRSLTRGRLAVSASLALLALGLLAPPPAQAQFGQNKVQYRSFRWLILETAHFKIHYYEQERPAALEAARMAERSYEYLSDFYQHQFEEKIPLILYSNHQDFEQSNVIGGFISEGTGGVTESLKGRVTLPLTGSYAELNHVLTHELVHAFQFDILQRSLRGLLGVGPLPLWMMEGMAEWVSNGMDPVTAMWVVDAVRRSKLPTVQEMATLQDIRVYRLGQALFEVIAQNYGEERVRRILKRPEGPGGRTPSETDSLRSPFDPPAAVLGRDAQSTLVDSVAFAPGAASTISLEKAWRAWTDSLAKQLGTALVDPDSTAERLTEAGKYGRSFHLAPSISPDGTRILYYSSRGLRNELFVLDYVEDHWEAQSLVSGEETPELETLPLLSASADWSPDGTQVVFVATEEGHDALQIFDVERRKIVKRLKTELFSIANPSWSPDGRHIVFSALSGGQEDLFLIELESGRVLRLTQDAYSERTPHFSPRGDALAFATDRGPQSNPRELLFGSWNVARMSLRTEGDRLVAERVDVIVESEANDFAPEWSPDGGSVAFVSDRDGTYQVYTVDLATGETRRRTQFDTGVIGIVPTGPAFSWAQNGDLVYSVFRNGGWTLYRTHGFPDEQPGEVDAEKMELTRSIPAEILEPAGSSAVLGERPYRVRLTPEYAILGGLYIGNGGAAGSGQLLLGDMLGNHYLYLSAYLRSQIDQSEFVVQYADLGQRWQWGVAAYQYRDEFGMYVSNDSAAATYATRNLIRLGVQGQMVYPFSRFRRVEFSLDLQSVNNQTAQYLFYGVEPTILDERRVYYVIPGLSYVFDNAAYSGFTPVAGRRWRVATEQALGNVEYSFGLLDWRRYLNLRMRNSLALRFLAAGSTGRDRQILYIGGPDTFRGADYGTMTGDRILVSSVELRFPILPATELLRGVVFADAASAWFDRGGVDFYTNGRLDDLKLAYGFGVRAFVGLPLRIDVAVPTDLQRSYDMHTMFSIGFDF